MKTIQNIKTILISALITYTVNVQAFTVTDPGSYAYYIQQLKKAAEQINQIKSQLSEAKKLNASFDTYMDDLREQFDFTAGIKKSLDNELKIFEDYKRKLSTDAKKALDFNREFDLKDLRDVIDTNLDGIYIDPTNTDYNVEDIRKLRTIERQRLLKDGLIKSEEKLVLLRGKLQEIQKLGDKSKQTKSTKEALDLNNVILLEILAAIHSLTDITATLGQAEMASKFIHYAKDEQQKSIAKAKGEAHQYGYSDDYSFSKWQQACRAYSMEYKRGADVTFFGRDCPAKAFRKSKEKRSKWKDSAKSRF